MILLDTHIWIRWLLPSQPLPINLVRQIEQTETVMVSAISLISKIKVMNEECKEISGFFYCDISGAKIRMIKVYIILLVEICRLPVLHLISQIL